jgi:hypothetical protein
MSSAKGSNMGILYDARKIKALEYLNELSEYAGLSSEWADRLWTMMLTDNDLYDEFVYYLEHHTFRDEYKISGYSLSDIYVWQMDKYNLIREIGKNPEHCNKETMVLNAFMTMAQMKSDPEKYVKRLESGRGNDLIP